MPEDEATWEPLQEFQDLCSDFQLEDELFLQAGRDVMASVQYTRRRHTSG
jgi:hypothetical protein